MELLLMLAILLSIFFGAYIGLWIIALLWRIIDKKSFIKAYQKFEMWGEN